MLEEYLLGYNDEDYVYIIEGCTNLYVQDEPLDDSLGPCDICGSYDWPYIDGYVYDIRKAVDEDDFYEISRKRELRDRLLLIRNVLSKNYYTEFVAEINKDISEPQKKLVLK